MRRVNEKDNEIFNRMLRKYYGWFAAPRNRPFKFEYFKFSSWLRQWLAQRAQGWLDDD